MPAPGKRPNRRIGPHFLHHAELGGRAPTHQPSLTPQQRMLSLAAVITAAFGVGLTFGIGWLADTFSRTKVLLSLCAAFIVLSLALPWALGASVFAAGVAFALGGIVLGFYTIGLAIIGDEVAPRDLASANAAFLVMYQIGGMIGPAAAGAAMTVAPVGGFVAAVSAIVLVGAFAIILIGQPTAKSP